MSNTENRNAQPTTIRQVFEVWDYAPDELVDAPFSKLRVADAKIVGERGNEQLVVEHEVVY